MSPGASTAHAQAFIMCPRGTRSPISSSAFRDQRMKRIWRVTAPGRCTGPANNYVSNGLYLHLRFVGVGGGEE